MCTYPFLTIIFEFLDHKNHEIEVLYEHITLLVNKLWTGKVLAAILAAIWNLTHLINSDFWAPTPKLFS
jgi:hypothetical protein